MNTLLTKLKRTLLTLFVAIPMLGIFGTAASQTPVDQTLNPPVEQSELGTDGTTVLDTGGFLAGGTISGGARYQIGNGLLIDGSYMRPIITLDPLELYSITAVKGEVYDLTAGNLGLGAMTGAGISYIDDNGQAFFLEARVWAVWEYGVSPALTPELAFGFVLPSEVVFGN